MKENKQRGSWLVDWLVGWLEGSIRFRSGFEDVDIEFVNNVMSGLGVDDKALCWLCERWLKDGRVKKGQVQPVFAYIRVWIYIPRGNGKMEKRNMTCLSIQKTPYKEHKIMGIHIQDGRHKNGRMEMFVNKSNSNKIRRLRRLWNDWCKIPSVKKEKRDIKLCKTGKKKHKARRTGVTHCLHPQHTPAQS